MPVPFREEESVERLGTAAFLRIERDAKGFRAALFLVDARGEPVEFAYNRLDFVQRFLWGKGQLRRHACRRLFSTLFEICPRVPSIVLCKAEEVTSEIFLEDIQVSLPVARIAENGADVAPAAGEQHDDAPDGGGLQLFWAGRPPAPETPERELLNQLTRRGFLIEPFDRAATGLGEVYGDSDVVG